MVGKHDAKWMYQKAKRLKNGKKRAQNAEKERAREEQNRRLIKSNVEKKKAEGKSEGHSKCKHDPMAPPLKKNAEGKQLCCIEEKERTEEEAN